jgi:DNA-directed RNA polymerase sigma subunit (sigma70/sigma32)
MSGLTPETRKRLDGINRLLEDVFKEPRLLSDMLRDAGLSEEEIARLRRDHLDAYVAGLLRRWRSWMAEILPSRRDDIVVRRYGLNGPPRPTLADLSDEYGISRERVRQLEKDALKRLRHPARRRRLERIALETAKEILGRSDPAGCN